NTRVIKKTVDRFAFTGLIKCGECGASITAEVHKGHTYYRCTKKVAACTQRFVREEALIEQINQAILKVFIDNEGKEILTNYLEKQNRQDEQASSSLLPQLQGKLREYDNQIERLIDLYIAKEITQEEYQRKKAKLLNEKKDLQGRVDDIRTNGGGWLEPAKEFVITCNRAGSVAWQGNPSAKRDFLKMLGSNFILKDRNLLFSIRSPFDKVARIGLKENWLPREDSNLGHGGYT
ncbi:MAG: hypothetical protein FJZ13_05090, partial [Candidatus Omnitrophica bacterium]|nr:hypothetical protein [Candidatus Omnitrophota bacterium]